MKSKGFGLNSSVFKTVISYSYTPVRVATPDILVIAQVQGKAEDAGNN